MRVLKFGGSSVASAERIIHVKDILFNYYTKNIKFSVVFSAFGGVTDDLIKAAELASQGRDNYIEVYNSILSRHIDTVNELFSDYPLVKGDVVDHLTQNFDNLKNLLNGVFLLLEATPRTMDYVLSFGERSSAYIISEYLKTCKLPASFLDARKIIFTDKNFGSASVDRKKTYKSILKYFSKEADIQIVTGFIASAKGGFTSTLGRGGSDFTAALIGAALNAEVIEIWTDVDGILTSDPRVVSQTFSIEGVSYEEAFEMSHFGAKVIYPPTIQPARELKIPLRIKNTFNPTHPGTLVSMGAKKNTHPVKAVSSIKDISLLTLQGSGMVGVPGTSSRLFRSLADKNINVILITQGSSEHTISFAINPHDVKIAEKSINKEFEFEISKKEIEPIIIENELSIIAIIGENMRYVPGIAAKMFWSLGSNGINIIAIAQGSSERNISVVINKYNLNKGLNSLHENFFLSEKRIINAYIIGVGLVGNTLINQIKKQLNYLREEKNLDLRIVGLANSKKMVFKKSGLPLENYKSLLNVGETFEKNAYQEKIISNNFNNSVFVDATASSEIPKLYKKLLENNISICTPNKIAASSEFDNYKNLNDIAIKNNVVFGYETNVGAGLPVISTIRDLIDSGDKIYKIKAVLSGSLSYIFNNFLSDKKLGDIVKEAKALGYTEPDPRTDLMGTDVKRKLTILIRESGYKIEENQIKVKSFLPEEALIENQTTEEFITALNDTDEYWSSIRTICKNEKKRPVFLATFDDEKAHIGLELVDQKSPFYNLKGSDNMIAISSKRYYKTPLVIQGPGAGPDVTAAGIFAEIISLAYKHLTL